jgi:adenylate cyclase class IV
MVLCSSNVPYARVRDEGFRTTMTLKEIDPETNFENEKEIIINDFDSGIEILLALGCKKKYYYEKIREIWHVKMMKLCLIQILVNQSGWRLNQKLKKV